jgi:hypothetical protein
MLLQERSELGKSIGRNGLWISQIPVMACKVASRGILSTKVKKIKKTTAT